jgi:SAM-dependent methyltransferase
MKRQLLEHLVCPASGDALTLETFKGDGDEILEGRLFSPSGRSYAISRGVPRMCSSELYASSFGYEWNSHSRIYLDGTDRFRIHSTQAQMKRKLGLTAATVRDRRLLDVGCGTGANAAAMAEWGAAEVFCVDVSSAVDAAFTNLRYRDNVHVVQADVFALPFRHETFDVIYSTGVLMHTPDTRQAFLSMVPLLRAEGTIAIWVYEDFRGITRWWSDVLRTVTTKMNPRVLHALCWLAVPAYYIYRVPTFGKAIFHFLPPVSKEPYWRDRVLDTFDWYSPTYQWKHTYPEVYAWFQEANLADMQLLDVPISMSGRKPAEAPAASVADMSSVRSARHHSPVRSGA